MAIFYSKEAGFQHDTDGIAIAADAKQIDEDTFTSLFEQQGQGKVIVCDGGGNPVAVDPAPSAIYSWNGSAWVADPTEALAEARTSQASAIDAAYASAVQASVSFTTAAGVTQTFQADTDSQDILAKAVQGYQMAGAVPTGFYWKAADNTLVPFTLADLEGLYGAIIAQGWAAFQKRTTLKTQITAATTVAAVQAVNWD
ncbi:DUF4376 domain-containing protein [Burkholderia multivorans]|uniref:DUF4376 domain-containing protein n=1 Tax=Burkholderia multivorans TaxID=87883 RepID=UPI0021BFDE75|nr:DUF4376 domain-containing protein [Burkholderia multivorans]